MLQYLIVLLDDTSVSFCDYDVKQKEKRLMSLNTLKEVIKFGMKENLMFQFVYPDYEIPAEYSELIEYLDHTKIKPAAHGNVDADVIVINDLSSVEGMTHVCGLSVIVKVEMDNLENNLENIKNLVRTFDRVNLIVHQTKHISDELQQKYKTVLDDLGKEYVQLTLEGAQKQINILSDRLFLGEMNNCGAGDTSITVAPDGNFYVCPAFYQSSLSNEETNENLGSLEEGLKISNPQLYKLSLSPICRTCDAYHCRRCIWLNKLRTLEVNTPGRTQCVMSHIERNASSRIKTVLKDKNDFSPNAELEETTCLDPFEKIRI